MRQHATEDGQGSRGLLVQSVEDDARLALEVFERPLRGNRHDDYPASQSMVSMCKREAKSYQASSFPTVDHKRSLPDVITADIFPYHPFT